MLFVKFSDICGIIILALYTNILSPIPNFKSSIIDKLCKDALFTVVPSSSTSSNIATGFIRPVLLGDHSISLKVVSAVSSCHLNAIAFRGNLEVVPKLSPYFISFNMSTKPSEG